MGYTKDVYKKAHSILNEYKQNASLVQIQHTNEIYSKIPKIKEIDSKLAQTGAEVVKLVISSPNDIKNLIERLEKTNLELQSLKAKLLVDNGYPADYMLLQHHCNICKDKGYVNNNKCECFKKLLKQVAYKNFQNIPNIDNYTFLNFDLEYYPKTQDEKGIVPYNHMLEVKKYCMEYSQNFCDNSGNILFIGKTGLGKTHLSVAIAKHAINKEYGVVYESSQNLLYKIEKEKFSNDYNKKEETDTLDMVLGCDLLILDDLGTEHLTQFTRSVIYNIINTRIITKKPTIISTNLDLSTLTQKYSDRIVSRLFGEYKVFKVFGNDIRIMKNFS